MSSRYDRWRENDDVYRAFVDEEKETKDGKKQYPWALSIVVPTTYAVMQTQLAFDYMAFTGASPVVGLDGNGPDDERGAKVMEQLLHYEWRMRRMGLQLWTWLLDRRRYGLGIASNLWHQEVAFRPKKAAAETRAIPLPMLGMTVQMPTKPRSGDPGVDEIVKYEGNEMSVIDPFKWWPDPRVPVSEFQQGEFCGHTVRRSYSYMLEQDGYFYTNVREIPKNRQIRPPTGDTFMSLGGDESNRDRAVGLTNLWSRFGDTVDFMENGFVELDQFVAKIIPRDYELGGSNRPQKWWLTLANDEVIVRAEPYGYEHDEYPYSIMEGSPDAHASMNPGVPEILQPLQTVMSWLFNSHIENVRKTLNDSLIVNPELIELSDLLEPQPGRLIRLREDAYKIPNAIEQAVKQLQVTDVTRSHLSDMGAVDELFRRVGAAPENLQGDISARDKTLGEQQMAQTNATNRLKVECRMAWEQGIVPWTVQRVANNQAYLSEDRFMRVVGRFPQAFGVRPDYPFVKVDRETIQGQFLYQVIEGAAKSSDQLLQTWTQILLEAAKVPMLVQGDPEGKRLDLFEVFREVAQYSGITNIDEFIRQGPAPMDPRMIGQPGGSNMSVVPDEQFQRGVQAGNYRPIDRGGGNGNGSVPGGLH